MQIDAFPGDIVIFARVINLLRGMVCDVNHTILLHYIKEILSFIVIHCCFTYRLFRTFIHYERSDRLSGHHETICRICSVGVSPLVVFAAQVYLLLVVYLV